MAVTSSNLTTRIAKWLIRRRWPLLVLSLLLTAAGAWPSTQLHFDTSITSLFPPDHQVLAASQESLRLFGGAELVVVAHTDPELLTPEGLRHRYAHTAARVRSPSS